MKTPQYILVQREFDLSYNIKEGVVKLNTNNTLTHELAKCKLAYLLSKQGRRVFTEVIFKTKGRADLVTGDGLIWEILHTEKLEDAKKKEKYYPASLFINYLKAEEVLKDEFEI